MLNDLHEYLSVLVLARYAQSRGRVVLKRLNARPWLPREKHLILLAEHGRVCFWCGVLLNGLYHIDHVVPRALGGEDQISNLVPSCPTCNLKKSDINPYDFALQFAPDCLQRLRVKLDGKIIPSGVLFRAYFEKHECWCVWSPRYSIFFKKVLGSDLFDGNDYLRVLSKRIRRPVLIVEPEMEDEVFQKLEVSYFLHNV